MSDGNRDNEQPLSELETWIMRVGVVAIVASMVLGLLQIYRDQQ